jgi:hypothetical protein
MSLQASQKESREMFGVYTTQTTTGKIRHEILEYGYRTQRHGTSASKERILAKIAKLENDPAAVEAAKEVLQRNNEFRISAGLAPKPE